MEHKISNSIKEKYIEGVWYKDRDNDFHKFKYFTDDIVYVSATVLKRLYNNGDTYFGVGYFNNKCIPMTIDEMRKYLPKEEWWTENELFPIY